MNTKQFTKYLDRWSNGNPYVHAYLGLDEQEREIIARQCIRLMAFLKSRRPEQMGIHAAGALELVAKIGIFLNGSEGDESINRILRLSSID